MSFLSKLFSTTTDTPIEGYRDKILIDAKGSYYIDKSGRNIHTKTKKVCKIKNGVIFDAKTGSELGKIINKPNSVQCIKQLDKSIEFSLAAYPCKINAIHEKISIDEMAEQSHTLDNYYPLEDTNWGKGGYPFPVVKHKADYYRDILTGKEGVVREFSTTIILKNEDPIFNLCMTFLVDKNNGHIIKCIETKSQSKELGIFSDPSSDIYVKGYRITFDVDGFNKFQDEYYEKNGFYYTQHWGNLSSDIKEFNSTTSEKIENILSTAREEDNKHQFSDWLNVKFIGKQSEIDINAGTKKKILVCDCNTDSGSRIRSIFKNLNYEYEKLEYAINEDVVIQKCSEIMPDIAYVRLNMLERANCDSIKYIRKLKSIKPNIKIILLYNMENYKHIPIYLDEHLFEAYWLEKIWEEKIEIQDIIPLNVNKNRMKICLEKQVREECNLPKHW